MSRTSFSGLLSLVTLAALGLAAPAPAAAQSITAERALLAGGHVLSPTVVEGIFTQPGAPSRKSVDPRQALLGGSAAAFEPPGESEVGPAPAGGPADVDGRRALLGRPASGTSR